MAMFRRVAALFRRSHMDREIESELREHMQMRIDDDVAQGMSRKEAERAARLEFGNPTAMRERVSAEDTTLGLDSIVRDVRYALRGFAKSPGFVLVAIATLALGIGANTAVFELLDAVRLRSLPVARPDELAELRIVGGPSFGLTERYYANFTVPMWQEIQRHHDPFAGVFAWQSDGLTLGKNREGRHVSSLEVSGDFFNVLGITPWQGRLIGPQDEASCKAWKAVVSYNFWQSDMGGAPITPETTLAVEGETVRVLGVTPPGFFGMIVGDRFDIAYPMCPGPNPRRDMFMYSVMGRLKPGWDLARASGYLASLSHGLFESTAPTGYSAKQTEHYKSFRLEAVPAGSGISALRERYDASLRLLLAITGLVLLIACANLANLMLARASVRQREIAIRMALGASRGRLVRQMLIESGLLAGIGAGLGVAVAQPLARLLVLSLNTSQYVIQLNVQPDWRVLLFAAGVAALTCVIFGTAPALRSAGADPIAAIRAGERGVVGNRERFSLQRLMVVTQIAVSMVLLVGALLFVRSYRNLVTLNTGVRETGMSIGYFGFERMKIAPENQAAFKRQLIEEIRNAPGVENAAGTTHILMLGGSWTHGVHTDTAEGSSKFTYVSPTFFKTSGIPLLTGRSFTDMDTNNTPYVLIVNQTFIKKFLGRGPAIGVNVRVIPEPDYPARTYEIVGTIPDTKYDDDLRHETPPMAFVPLAQLPPAAERSWVAVMIATSDTAAATNVVRQRIAAKYPEMSMQFEDFQQDLRDNLVGDRMMAMLSGFFGVLAAILVIVGLYGVLSYLLAQRRNEIGIRIALGARRGQVIGLVMRDTAKMLALGVAIGALLAILAGRGASAMLFGLKAWDPLTLGFAVLLLTAVAVGASLLPASRAARLDPAKALRTE
ncbi:ADOP family duplicated permease [Acidicapsa dinghuensis]|uniref:ADOP family duplicated permease n=1 Tax=Acidicapsa dinghuensis TaxID=2218256 RepID=A0ABW1E8Z8_9BACT|nr:ABC transporter permease [Acidicapsa dinghuensis]